ncbi:hypothetical protein D3C79_1015770 [compost metagenome]
MVSLKLSYPKFKKLLASTWFAIFIVIALPFDADSFPPLLEHAAKNINDNAIIENINFFSTFLFFIV